MDMWRKYQANKERYELNWKKFGFYVSEQLFLDFELQVDNNVSKEHAAIEKSRSGARKSVVFIVLAFACLVAIWWCYVGRRKDRRRLTRVL